MGDSEDVHAMCNSGDVHGVCDSGDVYGVCDSGMFIVCGDVHGVDGV